MKKLDAYTTYLILEGTSALFFGMIFTASSVYQVTVAQLSPLQLVLVGTMLELSVFVFEIPTGVVADVFSRRLSVIIGVCLIGLGFLLEGSLPLFWAIMLGQVIWGLGYTFTSGATQAWISDEIGEAQAGKAFLRSGQVSQVTALVGVGAGMFFGNLSVNYPILLGGLLLVVLGLFLAVFMPEHGFKPIPRQDRNSWQKMGDTFRDGLGMVRRRPALYTILTIGLFYGLYSEGFDRLWTKHLLDSFALPAWGNLSPVVWIGAIQAIGSLLSAAALGIAHRKVNTESQTATARALFRITALLILSLLTFALSPILILTLAARWLISITRSLIDPIYTAWVNQRLDSQVRATVISMSGQVDAIGQVAGGPIVGLIGNIVSVQAAITTSALILTPVLPLFAHAGRQDLPVEQIQETAETSTS